MKYEIDMNSVGQYIWRLRADNNLIVANGESYAAKQSCQHVIGLVHAARMEQFSVFPDARGEWRWHLRADNQEIIAQSSEGYRNRQDCDHAIRLVYGAGPSTVVVDLTVAGVRR